MKKILVIGLLVTGCATSPLVSNSRSLESDAQVNQGDSKRFASTPLSKDDAIKIIQKSFTGSTFSSIEASQQTVGEARKKYSVVIDEGYPDSNIVWVVALNGNLVYQSVHGGIQEDGTIVKHAFSSGIAIVDSQDGLIISTSLNP